MLLSQILHPSRIACDVEVTSKKRVLEKLSELIADGIPQLSRTDVFDSFVTRERLGSTGLGHGIAIPHGRAEHGNYTVGAFVKTLEGIEFESVDDQPVDLFFALLVPKESTDEHLQILSRLAGMFSDQGLVATLRNETTPEGIFTLLTRDPPDD